MEYLQKESRGQLTLYTTCLDDMIAHDNTVRAIDTFVDSLDLEQLGFASIASQGRPPYHPADLLKLFIYGYMNRMRSSRRLELECNRNIELIWLPGNLKPDHNTISRFRKHNPKAIKRVFRATVSIVQNHNLIGATLIAGNSTKLKENTTTENPQLSTSDSDSRHQITRGMITEICYTAQTTVDADHKLLIDYKVTNENDKKAMDTMLRRAKSILKTNNFTALYDKGYHTGSEFKTAHDLGIDTLVAIPAIGRNSQAPNTAYNVEYFKYHKTADYYRCPQGHKLVSNGNLYKARNYKFKQYKTSSCKNCPVRSQCTSSKVNGKIVQRSEYKQYIECNMHRVELLPDIYKKRQAIVEHPYGTMKRQWGFDYIITKNGIQSASADFGLIAIAYNLKRILNILKQQGKHALIYPTTLYNAILTLITTFLSGLKNRRTSPNPFSKSIHIPFLTYI